MTNVIMPCPFCNGLGEVEYDDTGHYHGSRGDYYVECSDCRARSGKCYPKEKAIEAWNKREK